MSNSQSPEFPHTEGLWLQLTAPDYKRYQFYSGAFGVTLEQCEFYPVEGDKVKERRTYCPVSQAEIDLAAAIKEAVRVYMLVKA